MPIVVKQKKSLGVIPPRTIRSLVAASALLACVVPAASIHAAQVVSEPVPITLNNNKTSANTNSVVVTQQPTSISSDAEQKKKNYFGYLAGGAVLAGSYYYRKAILKSKSTTLGGWIVGVVNDGLATAIATIGIIGESPNVITGVKNALSAGAGVWAGMVLGSAWAGYAAWQKCGWTSLDKVERRILAASAVGWGILLFNTSHPISSACISQAVNIVSGWLFAKHQYQNPKTVSSTGQAFYLIGTFINAYALTTLSAVDTQSVILVAGSCITNVMAAVGLVAGHWRFRRSAPLQSAEVK